MDRTDVLHEIEKKIGDLSVQALRMGGEPMLDRVEEALGVAIRHSIRIAAGVLQFSPRVEQEMRESLDRAQRAIHVVGTPNIIRRPS